MLSGLLFVVSGEGTGSMWTLFTPVPRRMESPNPASLESCLSASDSIGLNTGGNFMRLFLVRPS